MKATGDTLSIHVDIPQSEISIFKYLAKKMGWKIHQRDIIEVNYLFPDGTSKPHMAIVVSNDELQETEGFFYLAMISSKNYNPQYTYSLKNDMLSKPLSKQSFVIPGLTRNRILH